MDCSEAHRLLNRGVVPGAADPQRASLGFHLSGCTACRAYRQRRLEQQLLRALLAQQPRLPTRPPRQRPRRRAHHRLRAAGTALMIGGALALGLTNNIAVALANPPDPTAGAAYVVQSGDTLSSIAQRAYGNASLWSAIYQTNSPQINSPSLIYPGQQLSIPLLQLAPSGVGPSRPVSGPVYTVRSGDTLSSIALAFYGDSTRWRDIYQANSWQIGDPRLIYPGQQFSILSAPPNQAGTAAPAAPAPARTYTVQRGDSLWTIAQRTYGDPMRWSDIYAANRAAIGANPSLIFAGTVLNLPG